MEIKGTNALCSVSALWFLLVVAIFNAINNYLNLLRSCSLNTFHFRYKMAAIFKKWFKLLNTLVFFLN